jgi:hypothetical protein
MSPNFILLFSKGHAANAGTPRGPSLDLDDHFAARLAIEFFRRRHGFISS